MDLTIYTVFVALQLVSRISRCDETAEPTPVTGLIKKSIQLRCSLPLADIPRVQWFDLVYNNDTNPSRVFDSVNNTDRHIIESHPNRVSYEVDSNFTLIINYLKIDNDPGQYFCRSWTNETHYNTKAYYLTVGDDPQCDASGVKLRVGDRTVLTCQAKYSGNNQPGLRWFRDEQAIPSTDQFEIRTARRTVTLLASHTDDNLQYTCVMIFGDITEECSITLDVIYSVRDVQFLPQNRTQFYVGEQIVCSASGNPAPKISVEPPVGKTLPSPKIGRQIDIPSSWRDKNITLLCLAGNTLDGLPVRLNTSIVIQVLDRPSSTLPPEKPTALAKSKIDSDPGFVIGAVVIVALSLLAVIGAVVLVRKHRDQQRRKAEAAKAAANKNQENNQKKS